MSLPMTTRGDVLLSPPGDERDRASQLERELRRHGVLVGDPADAVRTEEPALVHYGAPFVCFLVMGARVSADRQDLAQSRRFTN